MSDLRAMCQDEGFERVRTYIASGNVIFASAASEAVIKAALERRLAAYAGKSVAVLVRTDQELLGVLARNPFAEAPGNRVAAVFLDAPPPSDALDHLVGAADEQVALGKREIYVRYGESMAKSKLKIPAARHGTARNMNTVHRLATLANEL